MEEAALEPYETKLVLTPTYIEKLILKEKRNQYRTKHPVGVLVLPVDEPFTVNWGDDGIQEYPEGGVILFDGKDFKVVSHETFELNYVQVKTKNTKLTKLGE